MNIFITSTAHFNQPDVYGVASYVAECLALFPWFFSSAFLVRLQDFPKLPLRRPPEAYIALRCPSDFCLDAPQRPYLVTNTPEVSLQHRAAPQPPGA